MNTSWLDINEYPFTSRYWSVDGHRMHYLDEGSGDVVLFAHGTPSWSFEFRNIIKRLRSQYRCIAVDHIGFGLSDKPTHYDYSARQHSRNFERFVVEKNRTGITLVVHDFGGPIALRAAVRHPDRIKRIILLNTWLWSTEQDPAFAKMAPMLKSPLLLFLYKYLNFSPRFLLPKSFGDTKLSPALLRQYTRPFPNPGERHGPLALARSLLKEQSWFEETWSLFPVLANRPALLLWGLKDPFITAAHLEKFCAAVASRRVITFESSGHFPHEENPAAVAGAISEWLDGSMQTSADPKPSTSTHDTV